MSSNDVFGKKAPSCHGSFALIASYGQPLRVFLFRLSIQFDVQHNYGPKESHALLCNSQQLRAILRELNPFHSSVEIPDLDALPSSDIP